MNLEGLKAGISLTFGMFILSFFQLPHGYWVLVTITVIYIVGGFTGLKLQKINKRIFGTFLGLILGIFLMVAWGYYDYRVLYLTPLAAFFMLYFYFITEDYTYMAVFVSIILLLTISMLTPSDFDLNIYDTAYSRIVCTVIGILVVIIVEYLLFNTQSKIENRIQPDLKMINKLFVDLTKDLILLFRDNKSIEKEFRDKYFEFYSKIDRFRLLLKTIEIELGHNKQKMKIYYRIYKNFYSSLDCIREIIFITSHNENKVKENSEVFTKINSYLVYNSPVEVKYKKIMKLLIYEKRRIENINQSSTDYYFIQSLCKLAGYLMNIDRLRKIVA